MGKAKEFARMFDEGLEWARNALTKYDREEVRKSVIFDVRKGIYPFAAGALYGLTEQEIKEDDRQQAR